MNSPYKDNFYLQRYTLISNKHQTLVNWYQPRGIRNKKPSATREEKESEGGETGVTFLAEPWNENPSRRKFFLSSFYRGEIRIGIHQVILR
jgi:hypothetical protein